MSSTKLQYNQNYSLYTLKHKKALKQVQSRAKVVADSRGGGNLRIYGNENDGTIIIVIPLKILTTEEFLPLSRSRFPNFQ